MSGGSSSSWLEGWSGTYHGWHDTSSSDPAPLELALDESVLNATHRLQDQFQQMLALTQRSSKGNAACAAMEDVTVAREWQEQAKLLRTDPVRQEWPLPPPLPARGSALAWHLHSGVTQTAATETF